MIAKDKQSCFANDRLRVSVTDTCNLRCDYCSNEGQYHNNKKYLDLGTYKAFLKKVKDERIYIRKLNITGGEPLLHPKLYSILAESIDAADEVTVNTNGLLLTKGIITEFHRIGVKNIKFGVDWIFGDSIKPSKNKPKFNRIDFIENLMYAIEIMPRTSINIVISEFNAHRIEEMIDFVVSNGIDKVELLEMIEHDFRKSGYFPKRILSAKELVSILSDRFERIEYNAQLAKYICFLQNGLMIQFAEDFCRMGICQNLWTRMDVNCDISPCLKNARTYTLNIDANIATQILKLNSMMCNSSNNHFPWHWSEAIINENANKSSRASSEDGKDKRITVYGSMLDP